jgi:pyruvate dehydrogenase (quinone)
MQKIEQPSTSRWLLPEPPVVIPSNGLLASIAELVNSAERVTILAGAGCAGAHDEVVALARLLNAPIVHALRGKEHIEWDNPFDVGMTGLIGFSSGYHAMKDCDALLMLGTDFPYRQFYPTAARIVQIDIDPTRLGRRTPLALGAVGDIAPTLKALMPLLDQSFDGDHLSCSLENYKAARSGLDDLATPGRGKGPIHPQYLARLVSEIAADDAVFTCDVGTPTVWAARYLHMNGKRRLLGSFVHGSMANAMVQALGAQAAYPGRQIVSLSGDGGFAMLMGDFITLVQQKLPVKVVIFDNSVLGFVDLEMRASGFLSSGTDLVNPDFAQMASAMGVFGIRVEKAADLEDALLAAFAHDGPALVDVVTNRDELVMPPKTTLEQIGGFSLWMAKAVLNGRGNEVIDLASSNILR